MESQVGQKSLDSCVVNINDLRIEGYISQSGTANFLSIPYAEIPARFRQARPVHPEKLTGVINARTFGPTCPQPIDGGRILRPYLYEGIKPSSSKSSSEFGCLRLNIYGPPNAVKRKEKLPVLIWIHGGGWTFGDGNGDYTGEFQVRSSMENDKPFIYVGINYRLGYFGFLTSEELREEAQSYGEVGYANQGMYDQRLAIQWVHNNIHHFGGDASQITLAGESAGGWSVLAHLRSTFPACKRAWIMSAPSWPNPAADLGQKIFDRLVECTGTPTNAPACDKISALRDLSSAELEKLLGGVFTFPNPDPHWFVGQEMDGWILERTEGFPSWLEMVVVSSTLEEYAQPFQIKFGTPQEVRKSLKMIAKDEAFEKEVINAYELENAKDDMDLMEKLTQLFVDGYFGTLPYTLANQSTTPVSIMRFDQKDTWEGSPFQNFAYHAFDCPFFCRLPGVAGKDAPADWKATSDVMSDIITDLVVIGKQPWENYQANKKIMVVNGNRSEVIKTSGTEPFQRFLDTPERHSKFTLLCRGMFLSNRKPLF